MKRLIFKSLLLLSLSFSLSEISFASTTWYVDGVNGSDANDCKSPMTACKSIGHAISLASSGDSIMVAPATYTENLTIGISLKVIGSGASTTIIDGGGAGTVVAISSTSTHVTLAKITVRNGFAVTGGGVSNNGVLTVNNAMITGNAAYGRTSGTGSGGGISNNGTLTMNSSILNGNLALGKYGDGGAIRNNGTLVLNNSTVSANYASGSSAGGGGGILNTGTLTIKNSTISGNSSGGYSWAYGGGIASSTSGIVVITNSTITGNKASAHAGSGGGIGNFGTLTMSNVTVSGNRAPFGSGIFALRGHPVTLQDSIVANSDSGNCYGTMTSNGYNLSSDDSCNFNGPGDLNNTDPMLGPLQNNGGPTQTMALVSGSPAVDAGNPSGCTDGLGHLLKTDQRGKPRPDREDSGGCDMGAYESQSD